MLDHSTGNFPYPSSPYSCIGDSVTVPECALLREGSDHCGLNSRVNKDRSYITLYLIRPSAYSIVRQYGNCFHVPWPEKEFLFLLIFESFTSMSKIYCLRNFYLPLTIIYNRTHSKLNNFFKKNFSLRS